MLCLAIDTSSNLCAAAIIDSDDGTVLAEISEDIGKGHAERLMDVISECLERANITYDHIGKVISTIGPGSFTGVRVGLATARGIALGLSIPIVGVSTLDALEAEAREAKPDGSVLTVMDAKRGELYAQWGGSKRPAPFKSPSVLPLERANEILDANPVALCGSGAPLLASNRLDAEILHTKGAANIVTVAQIGMGRPADDERPQPLYLREPDAKVPTDFAIARKA